MMIGKTLSHYRIVEELGRGGMGVVYKAEDTSLNRTVAVKVLPATTLTSEDDRARFYREARAAAALNHPNIAVIHAIDEAKPEPSESSETFLFIAMEYIDGGTLEDRISKGPLKLKEAQSIAIQIAKALDAAHGKAIVHRDIKPGNVMWNEKGLAKVLDFGLAQTSHSTKLTQLGSTLGTIAYMSPEQARGDEVDHRSDMWSLGVVLYEMISGRRPFASEYEQAAVYSILNEDPEPLTAVRTGVPMELERIVNKCLAKQAARRYQHADELIADLEAVDLSQATTTQRIATPQAALGSSKSPLPKLVAIGAVFAVIGVVLLRLLAPANADVDKYRPTSVSRVTYESDLEWWPTIHPDGDIVVYAAGNIGATRLYYRSTGLGEPTLLVRGLDAEQRTPEFSPDGSEILFESEGSIFRVNSLGGAANVIVRPRENESNLLFPAWSPTGDQIVYTSEDDSVFVFDLETRDSRAVAAIQRPHSPSWSPDGKKIALVSNNLWQAQIGNNLLPSSLVVLDLEDGNQITLTDDEHMDMSPRWTPDGKGLLYVSSEGGGNDVWYQGINSRGEADGPSLMITVGLDLHWLDLSYNPVRLVTTALSNNINIWKAPLVEGRVTTEEDFVPVTSGSQSIEHAIVSPDGSKLAFNSNIKGGSKIFTSSLDGSNISQVTFDKYWDFASSWSPDSKELGFHRYIDGTRNLYVVSLDDNEVSPVFSDSAHDWYATYSYDGSMLGFGRSTGTRDEFLVLHRTESGSWENPEVLFTDYLNNATFSPVELSVGFVRGKDIYTFDVESRQEKQLTTFGDVSDDFVSFSEDGEQIYFRRFRDGRASVWEMEKSGANAHLKIEMGSKPIGKDINSVHDQTYYFTIQNIENDIWVMDLPK